MHHPTLSNIRFVRNFLITMACALVLLTATILVADPFDNLHLSPPIERGVIAHNQRFGFASLARSHQFDSAIFGTSTTRMIDPAHINDGLKARFVNLSLNSGTWWEQRELFQLFLTHHPKPNRIIIGLDVIWCKPDGQGERLTKRIFPTWMYDENPWNDYLHTLNFKTLERSFEQVVHILGYDKSRYGNNGFRSLNKKGKPYDISKARRKIYGQTEPIPPAPPVNPPEIGAAERESWPYPNIDILNDMLASLPEETHKLLIFVPYHHNLLGAPGAKTMIRYQECKRRVVGLKERFPNLKIMDFMFRSQFTTNDANYWDVLHFNDEAALSVEQKIVEFWTKSVVDPLFFKGL